MSDLPGDHKERKSPAARTWRHALIAVLLIVLAVMFGEILWLTAQRIATATNQWGRSRELAKAMVRWERFGPSDYELAIAIAGKWGECQAHFRIERDSAPTNLENRCSAPFGEQMYRYIGSPATVAELFVYIEAGIHSRSCGPNGCRCDGVLTVEAAYDEDLGYPGVDSELLQARLVLNAVAAKSGGWERLYVDRDDPS